MTPQRRISRRRTRANVAMLSLLLSTLLLASSIVQGQSVSSTSRTNRQSSVKRISNVKVPTGTSALSSPVGQGQVERQLTTNHDRERELQKDDNNDKNDNKDDDKDDNKNEKNVQSTDSPTSVPTTRPTSRPTPLPSVSPSQQPSLAPVTTRSPSLPPAAASVGTVSLSMDDLREIQYYGGGGITLRLSLWFQDATRAESISAQQETAVLQSLQHLLCQSDMDKEALNELGMTMATYAMEDKGTEERELCVIKSELSQTVDLRNEHERQGVEGSILLQPPSTFVVDVNSDDDSSSQLQWTTWRITWPVLRLGTFYILQGLENAVPVMDEGDQLSQEEIYRAGVQAMQHVLELALMVSIREKSLDQVLMSAFVANGQNDGMVLASVYGEEVATLQPKLEWLGIVPTTSNVQTHPDVTAEGVAEETSSTASTSNNNEDSPGGAGGVEEDHPESSASDMLFPTTLASDGNMTDSEDDDDDGWDDDRYDMEYGITEQLSPVFWHPLRIAGIIMFFLTLVSLVSLARMSRRRLKRREEERKLAKDRSGLLNNPEGMEEWLQSSKRLTAPTSNSLGDNNKDGDDVGGSMSIPMPSNLEMS